MKRPPASTSPLSTDSVTLLIEQWARERPDLGAHVPSIVARILRLASHLRRRADLRQQAALGISWDIGEIVIALRRRGAPYEMTPTELYKSMLLTSGAITSRLDKAEALGLIRRVASDSDRRSIKVQLTEDGRKMGDDAITTYYAEMQLLLAPLAGIEHEQLAASLSKLLAHIEQLGEADALPAPDKGSE